MLINTLISEGVERRTLLDIGGGIGAIQHALFASGIVSTISVDASIEYIRVAQKEALRLGNLERTKTYHGDFVELQDQVEAADIVTLDRVLCCYADAEQLIAASANKAARLYGLVYPRGTVFSRLGILAFNAMCWLSLKNFRTYYHRPINIHRQVTSTGLSEVFRGKTLLWRIVVYKRP